MADEITPTTTSAPAPPSAAALNTANFPAKPEVSGMPAKASRKTANTAATSGERRPSPAHLDRCVASPPASRTRVTTANAPIVTKEYAPR